VRFKWDARKAASNLKKHKISFDEATSVFRDPLAVIFDDEDHSADEGREIIIGHSLLNRLVLVCFTERQNGDVRILRANSPAKNEKTMKKARASKTRKNVDSEMRPEYRFDYRKGRPNRFASRANDEALIVLVDPDIAEVFPNSESVNRALRALISALPKKEGSKHLGRR